MASPFTLRLPAKQLLASTAFASLALLTSAQVHASQTDVVADMRLQFVRYSKAVILAEHGKPEVFAQLRESHDRLISDLSTLQKGGTFQNCPVAAPSTTMQSRLNNIVAAWKNFNDIGSYLQTQEAMLQEVRAAAKEINSNEPKLTELTEQLAAMRMQNSSNSHETIAVTQLIFLQTRIINNTNRVLQDDMVEPEAAFLVNKDPKTFTDLINGLSNGSEKLHLKPVKGQDREKLLELSKQFDIDNKATATIIKNLKPIIDVKRGTQYTMTYGENFSSLLQQLQRELPQHQDCDSWKLD